MTENEEQGIIGTTQSPPSSEPKKEAAKPVKQDRKPRTAMPKKAAPKRPSKALINAARKELKSVKGNKKPAESKKPVLLPKQKITPETVLKLVNQVQERIIAMDTKLDEQAKRIGTDNAIYMNQLTGHSHALSTIRSELALHNSNLRYLDSFTTKTDMFGYETARHDAKEDRASLEWVKIHKNNEYYTKSQMQEVVKNFGLRTLGISLGWLAWFIVEATALVTNFLPLAFLWGVVGFSLMVVASSSIWREPM